LGNYKIVESYITEKILSLFMSAVKLLPHYTYEDYCHWEGRWEVIDGISYAMIPAPSHCISGL
jgi:hypothetical protein